jgi:DNA-binding NarL/FixJ family response regulator
MKIKLTWVILAVAGYFFVLDVLQDIREGETLSQWGVEALVFVAILGSLGYEIVQTFLMHRKLRTKEIELRSLKGHLADVVKVQLENWKLSSSESEVAWLIIKGFSFIEISSMRAVAEKTIRAQAVAIYKKSGTSNRSEFTATFLDDLLNERPRP